MHRFTEFQTIWRKNNGVGVIRQAFREHIAVSVGLAAILCGPSKKGLEVVREFISLKLYRRVCKSVYVNFDELSDRVEEEYRNSPVGRNDVVWCLWLQGEEQAPDIVRACIQSLRRRCPGKKVIVLTESDAIARCALPKYILEKYKAGYISRTAFSDLVRLDLLCRYGGTWADATVWLSSEPDSYTIDSDLFFFQSLKPGADAKSLCVSSWWLTAHKPSRILLMTRALLFAWWETHDYSFDYFMLHYYMQVAMAEYEREASCIPPASNSMPHSILLRMAQPFDQSIYDAICSQTRIHKLSYKIGDAATDWSDTFAGWIIGHMTLSSEREAGGAH